MHTILAFLSAVGLTLLVDGNMMIITVKFCQHFGSEISKMSFEDSSDDLLILVSHNSSS